MTTAFCPSLYLPLGSSRSTPLRRPRRIVASISSSSTTSSSTSYSNTRLQSAPSRIPSSSCTPPSPNSRPPGDKPPPSNRSPDFHANVGTVIDTLRSDYPYLLTHTPDLSMFRDDIVLSDAQGNQLTGKDAYRTVLFLLRAHAKLFLTNSNVHIVSMYYHEDTRPAVHVRWRMRATPRAWASSHTQSTAIIDGISVYYLDYCGRVAQHAFETKIRSGPQVVIKPVFRRIVTVGHVAVETGMHIPQRINSSTLKSSSLKYIDELNLEAFSQCREQDEEVNDGNVWGSLPLSVQFGILQYVYQMLGTNENSNSKESEEVIHLDVGKLSLLTNAR